MLHRPAETVRLKARLPGGRRATYGVLTRKMESSRCRDPYCTPLHKDDGAAAAVAATPSPATPALPMLLFPAMNLLRAHTAVQR